MDIVLDMVGAVIQAIAMILGVYIALRPGHGKKHRRPYLVTFIAFGLVGIIVTVYHAFSTDKSQREIISELTGGNSFPIFTPSVRSYDGECCSVTLAVDGDYSLREVRWRMMTGPGPFMPTRDEVGAILTAHPTRFDYHYVGVLIAHLAQPLDVNVEAPIFGVNQYDFSVLALNGSTTTVLKTWRDADHVRWHWSTVTKTDPGKTLNEEWR